MPTKVCHVTSLHKANDGRIFLRYCKSLAKKYDVFLVAPNTETRIVEGVNVVGVPMPDINHRIKRWLQLKTILKPLYEIDADVYHFHDPELMKLGLKLKKRGKKIIFDSHEDVLNQIKTKDYIPKPFRKLAEKLYGIHERRCLSKYTAVVSVTGYIVDRLKTINPNTYQITNYPVYEERHFENRPWDRTICFAGLLCDDWMLKEIISVLPRVNAKMIIAGFYSGEDYLNELRALPGWANVEFLGTLPHEKVVDFYNKSSIGIAIESYDNPNANYRTGSLGCTKIPDYMASGLPILVSNSEVWGGMVRKYNCGIAIENPKDSNEIAKVISRLLDNKDMAKQMGVNSLAAFNDEFNWNSQEKIMFNMYDDILGA